MIRSGAGGLCVDISAPKGHDVWDNPAAFKDGVLSGLAKVGLINGPSDVLSIEAERVRQCYPIYFTGYKKPLEDLERSLKRWANLTLAGRTGRYWYNNMDHSIAQAMELARTIASGEDI